MNRVPVVPWSTAAAYFAMSLLSGARLGRTPRDERVLDEEVVDQDADHASDEWTDDRDPEVGAEVAPVAGQRHLAPSGDGREEARAEVAGRVDRVAGVRAVRHADGRHRQADQPRR